jgi:hypothetical protein
MDGLNTTYQWLVLILLILILLLGTGPFWRR